MDRESFFESLYRDAEGVIAFCNSDDVGKHFPVNRIPEPDDKHYFTLGILEKKPPKGRRNPGELVKWLTCVWMDIDFDGKAGAVKRYPTEKIAMEAIAKMPYPPSAIIRTANGIHVYWFLNQPVDAERVEAACYRWQFLYQRHLKSYVIDSTHNRSRILRIPGTVRDGKPVEIVSMEQRYYSIDDIEDVLPQDLPRHDQNAGAEQIDPAIIDPYRIATLLVNCPELRDCMEHKRLMDGQMDGGNSGYDYQIAKLCRQAALSKEDTAALVVQHRQQWEPTESFAESARKAGYVIPKIWERFQPEFDQLDTVVEKLKDDVVEMPPEDARAARLRALSDRLGFDVARVVQYGREWATASVAVICADGREIDLGKADTLLCHSMLRKRLFVEQDVLLSIEKSENSWGNFVAAVIKPLREIEDFEEYTLATSVAGMLEAYVAEYDRFRDLFSCVGDRVRDKKPIPLEGGSYAINLNAFSDWIANRTKNKLTTTALGRICSGLGMVRKQHSGRDSQGILRNRNYWEPPLEPLDT